MQQAAPATGAAGGGFNGVGQAAGLAAEGGALSHGWEPVVVDLSKCANGAADRQGPSIAKNGFWAINERNIDAGNRGGCAIAQA